MDTLAVNLLIAVLGGLVATFLTLVIHRTWQVIIVPWYEERVYQDVHFEGTWIAIETFTDTSCLEVDQFVIQLKRQGHNVTGTAVCTSGPDNGKVYVHTGSFKNLILTALWTSQDATSLERGATVLKLVENGKKLVGHGLFYSPLTEKVHTSTFVAVPQDTLTAAATPNSAVHDVGTSSAGSSA